MRWIKNERFFDLNIQLLKLAGVWVPDRGESVPVQILYWVYNLTINGFSLGFFMPCEFVSFSSSRRDINDAIKNASVAFTHLLAAYKVYVWLKGRKVILNMISELEGKVGEYEALDDFRPEEMVQTEKKTKNLTFCIFFSLCLSVSITAFSGSTAILLTDYQKYEVYQLDPYTNTSTYRYNQSLPYWAWLPFATDTSKLRFFIGVCYTCFPALQQAWTIAGTDLLFTALISYISVQLRIIQGGLKTIRPRCLKRLKLIDENMFHDNEVLSAEMMKEMNRCIEHLQLIFKTCEKMEKIYTYLTLLQVLMSEILICTCLFLVSSIPMTSKAFATELVYLIAIEFQIALYCFFGNKVTVTGEDIPRAIYEGDWLSSTTSFKKSMLVTMTRMKRPIHLTMGKFSNLTLATFVTIGRASYSFFAVLKNRDVEE